jgi:outer membrane protein assembly factor BamB
MPVGFALALAAPARADDWRQFHHDAQRTGASGDPVRLPLVEIWTLPARSTPAVAAGRIYYLRSGSRRANSGQDGAHRRVLISADARTGRPLWRDEDADLMPSFLMVNSQPALQPGPVVTQSGVVLIHDIVPVPLEVTANRRILSMGLGMRAFGAVDGRRLVTLVHPTPGAPETLAGGGANMSYLVLLAGHGGENLLVPVTDPPPTPSAFDPVGPPLVTDDEVMALGAGNLFFRWAPYSVAPGRFTRYIYFTHPLARQGALPDHWWEFSGSIFEYYPMAATPGGVLVADSEGNRYLAVVTPSGTPLWHRDMPWTIGLPAVGRNGLLMMGVGGPGATRGIMAFDPGNGVTRWTYAPQGLPPDPIDVTWQPYFDGQAAARALQPTAPGSGLQPAGAAGGAPPGRGARPPFGDPRRRPAAAQGMAPDPHSRYPGHTENPGLVAAGNRVCGVVGQSLVALDQANGALLWQQPVPPLRPGDKVRCLAASAGHLFLLRDTGLTAFRLADGQPEWSQPMLHGGALALADGMLYVSSGPGTPPDPLPALHAFAPAERTYRMAVDSDRASAYLPERPSAGDPAEAGAAGPDAGSPIAPVEGRRADPGPPAGELRPKPPAAAGQAAADATVLRLRWDEPPAERLRRASERRPAARELPMLLSLDWLDAGRASIAAPGGATWTAAGIQAFAAACAALAAAAQPAHFDVAPEVNVYLARHPEQAEAVLALVQAAKEAIRKASPATKVLVSLNGEVLAGTYGRGSYLPFGPLARLKQAKLVLPPVVDTVDEVGLTTYPQSAYARGNEVPYDYLLRFREALGEKPLLISRLALQAEPPRAPAPVSQLLFLKRFFQSAYWIDAAVVAYPELFDGANAARVALVADGKPRPALQAWTDVLGWKRVKRLTLARKELGPPAPGSEEEEGTGDAR